MGKNYLSDLEGPYQTQAPDDWSWLDYIKAAGSDTGNALSNLAGGIVGGMSPFAPTATQYGKPSLQVPPMIYDAWEAINAPGKILNEGMTPEDRDRTATNAAGFMMGGGLVAPKRLGSSISPDLAIARTAERLFPDEQAIVDGLPFGTVIENRTPKTFGYHDDGLQAIGPWGLYGERARVLERGPANNDTPFASGNSIGQMISDAYLADPVGMRDIWSKSFPESRAAFANEQRNGFTVLDGELFSNGSKPGAAVGNALVESQQPKGFTAYHGSPHDFDKFSLDKIGTGEGAQAYGHGLYFAENEGVAKSYRDLATSNINGVPFDMNNPLHRASQMAGDSGREAAIADARNRFKNDPSIYWERVVSRLTSDDDLPNLTSNGSMYQVRINADPESFLDWDKPLSQQPQAARSVIESDPLFGTDMYSSAPDNTMRNLLRDYSTTAKLREAGIPGIRYLDGNSRGKGEGSSNYVVFDESLIDILKKYGLTGGAIGAGSALNWDDPTTY